uniref:B box-type domain-containing protein n=1 Tax=Varanus komodoensis TaxID=61221 RepID=A0A8D2LBD6_VARKO
ESAGWSGSNSGSNHLRLLPFFEDPVVVTNCGHGFCKACSTKYPQVSDEHLPCPECRKESSLRNIPHSVGLGNKSLEIEKMCREHKEALRLFCVTDEILICASCMSKAHQNHTVARVEEAAADYKVTVY